MKKKLFIILISLSLFTMLSASEHDVSIGIHFLTGSGIKYADKSDHDKTVKFEVNNFGIGFENYNIMFNNIGFMEKVAFGYPLTHEDDGFDFYLLAGPVYQINLGNPTKLQLAAGIQINHSEGVNHSSSTTKETIDLFHMGLATEARFKFTAHKRCSPVIAIGFGFDPIVNGEFSRYYKPSLYSNDESITTSKFDGSLFTFTLSGQFCFNIK